MIGGIAAISGIITTRTDLTAAPWLWIFIGLGVLVLFFAAFLAFHRIREELDKLKDTLPSITVTSDPDASWVRLSVHNHGGDAEFRAIAQVIHKGKPGALPWPINWHGSLEEVQRIFKNDHHILNIANRDWQYGHFDQEGKPTILFFTAKQSTGITLGQEQFSDHFNLLPDSTKVELEVTITSHPELRLPFKERYIIKLTEDGITLEPPHHD